MNKSDLSRAIYNVHGGMSFADTQKVIDLMLEIIKSRLCRGEKVLISGFGCFRVMKRKNKRGINPKTGEAIQITGQKTVKFKPSKYLKMVQAP